MKEQIASYFSVRTMSSIYGSEFELIRRNITRVLLSNTATHVARASKHFSQSYTSWASAALKSVLKQEKCLCISTWLEVEQEIWCMLSPSSKCPICHPLQQSAAHSEPKCHTKVTPSQPMPAPTKSATTPHPPTPLVSTTPVNGGKTRQQMTWLNNWMT